MASSPGFNSARIGVAAKVVGVDLDDLTLGKVETALQGTELALAITSRREAVERVRAMEERVIVLLEWPDEYQQERIQLCSALRAVTPPDHCYIVALGGASDHQAALSDAMGGPANDVLTRPFGNSILLGRLRKGLRAMTGGGAPGPRAALDEAVRERRTGEVMIRAGDKAAIIHLQEGQIVWVHVSFVPTTMEDVARRAGAALDPELVADVKEECRATGANFLDVLVSWGVLAPERAKAALRELVAERVRIALEIPGAAALFMPKKRSPSGQFRIHADEIPALQTPSHATETEPRRGPDVELRSAETPAVPSPRPSAPSAFEAGWYVNEAMKTEGAMCAAVLDRRTGACLFQLGAQLNAAVAWSLVSTLAAAGPGADEVIAVVGGTCFVTRPLRHATSCALFVALSSTNTTLGFARISIARVAATHVAALTTSPTSVRFVESPNGKDEDLRGESGATSGTWESQVRPPDTRRSAGVTASENAAE